RFAMPPNASAPCRPACGSLPPAAPPLATRHLEDRPLLPSSPAATPPQSPPPPAPGSRAATPSAFLPLSKGAPDPGYLGSLRSKLDRSSLQPWTSAAGPLVPPPLTYTSPHAGPAQRIAPYQS